MNRRNDATLNNSICSRCSNLIPKNFMIADISILRKYNKNKKQNRLNFFFNIFTINLLIWILLCSNNWSSCKSWNYKNKIERTHLESKRSLAESKEIKKPKNIGSKMYSVDESKSRNLERSLEEPLQSRIRNTDNSDKKEETIEEIDEKIDIELGSTVQKKDVNYIKNHYEGILEMLKCNKRKITLFSVIFLSIISFLINISMDICSKLRCSFDYIPELNTFAFLLISISLILLITVLIRDETEIIKKNKL